MDANEHAREEFFSEAQEIVEELGRDLVLLDDVLRAGREDPDLVNSLFRGVHTIKGNAYTFGAQLVGDFSDRLETLLSRLRLGKMDVTSELLGVLYRSLDLYPKLLQAERAGRTAPSPEMAALLAEVALFLPENVAPPAKTAYELDPELLGALTEYEEHRLQTCIAQDWSLYWVKVMLSLATMKEALEELKGLIKPLGEMIACLPAEPGEDLDSLGLDLLVATSATAAALAAALAGKEARIEEIPRGGAPLHAELLPPAMLSESPPPRAIPGVPDAPSQIAPALVAFESEMPPAAPGGGTSVDSLVSSAHVRVDIHKLDRLMNTVGDLAIVRTQLAHLVERLRASRTDRELTAALHRLQRSFERQLAPLQQGILEVRMVPLGQVFDQLATEVRRVSLKLSKSVHLVITGGETEVDKLIAEALSDPLKHMIRNAVDHGLEPRHEREAAGKPATGTIALNAYQKGSHFVIELEDDGKGIHSEKLLQKALERGSVTQEEALSMSPREVLNLIFLPGVTTKATADDISGRGVGMDVVKTNIARLGGVIDIASEPGMGTKLTVTLPITLAIINALLVRCSDRLFALPLSHVQEAVAFDISAVETVDGREMITLRGRTLPLCSLTRLFELPGVVQRLEPAPELENRTQFLSFPGNLDEGPGARWGDVEAASGPPRRQFIVVTSVGERRLGIVVEALVGKQDIVIKSLGPSLNTVRGFSGATELGDQRIALVLDVPALVEETLSHGAR